MAPGCGPVKIQKTPALFGGVQPSAQVNLDAFRLVKIAQDYRVVRIRMIRRYMAGIRTAIIGRGSAL
jgi:hypothetical protein